MVILINKAPHKDFSNLYETMSGYRCSRCVRAVRTAQCRLQCAFEESFKPREVLIPQTLLRCHAESTNRRESAAGAGQS